MMRRQQRLLSCFCCKAKTAARNNKTVLILSSMLYIHCLYRMLIIHTKTTSSSSPTNKRYNDELIIETIVAAANNKEKQVFNVRTEDQQPMTKVLLGIERIDKLSFPMVQSTSWGKNGSSTVFSSQSSLLSPARSLSSFAAMTNDDNSDDIPSMKIDVTRYRTKNQMIETGRYDWYVRCPSTAYVDTYSLRNELLINNVFQKNSGREGDTDADTAPIYIGMVMPAITMPTANDSLNDSVQQQKHDNRFCQIWNWATAERLMEHCNLIKDGKRIDQCLLNKGNVTMTSYYNTDQQKKDAYQKADEDAPGIIMHRPSSRYASRCFPTFESSSSPSIMNPNYGEDAEVIALSSSWMEPNAFPGKVPGNLGYFLSKEYSHLFYGNQHIRKESENAIESDYYIRNYLYKDAVECKCTLSTTNEVLRSCGGFGTKGDRMEHCETKEERLAASYLPSCYENDDYYLSISSTENNNNTNNDNDNQVEHYNETIPAYVISMNQTLAQQRLDMYMPNIPFQTQNVVDAVALPSNGQEGYRQSMAKALQEGISSNDSDSDLFAIFDDDFRVHKNFDQKWNDLVTSFTSSSFCYHDTLINRGGVLLLGASIWNFDMFDFLLMEEKNNHTTNDADKNRYYVHYSSINQTNAVCYDAHSFVKGSFAAIYSKNAAKHILTWLNVTSSYSSAGATRAYDWVWGDMIEMGLFPVRVLFDHLFVADVGHASSVNANRQSLGPESRHRKMRWGPVNSYLPESGAY